MKIFLNTSVFLLASSLVFVAQAASNKKTAKPKFERVQLEPFTDPIMDDKVYDAYLKDAKERSKRGVAADSFVETEAFSESYLNLRGEIIGGKKFQSKQEVSGQDFPGIGSPENLDVLIEKYAPVAGMKDGRKNFTDNPAFTALDDDAKLIALQLLSVRPFKSFVYRAQKYFGGHSALRASIVQGLRMNAQTINVFLPTDQWKAGFKYVTEPMTGMADSILKDDDLEGFIANELLPAVKYNTEKVSEIVRKRKPMWWDNKIYFSANKFTNEIGVRYVRLGIAEQDMIASSAYGSLAAVYSIAAYSLDGLSDAVKDLAIKFGVDVVNPVAPPDGVTAKEKFKILKGHKQLLVLREQSWMAESYKQWVTSARFAQTAWKGLNSPNSDATVANNIINAQGIIPFQSIKTVTDNAKILLETQNGISSAVIQGETVKVNIHTFFHKSPNMADLYPTDFNDDRVKGMKWTKPGITEKEIDGKRVEYRDYTWHNATHWNRAAYAKIFPDLPAADQNGNTSAIVNRAKVLSQAWGGWIIGLPISNFIY